MIFRRASMDDFDDVVRITGEGREALAALGIDQWQGGNPTPEQIRADIEAGHTYVAVALLRDANDMGIDPGDVVGTLALVGGGEADYSRVTSGAWLTSSPNSPHEASEQGAPVRYATLHRLAVAACAIRRGIASFMVNMSCELARADGLASVRADTHEGNIPMQRAFEKCGMQRCCEIEITNPFEPTKKRVGYEIAF